MSDRLIVVSTDCHTGLPIADYKPYVEARYHAMLDMAVPVQLEMMEKASRSFIHEINEAWRAPIRQQLTGAWDYGERLNMLAGDGIAAEVLFPDGITEFNTLPFGAGLGLSPRDAVPELQWAGRWRTTAGWRILCQRSGATSWRGLHSAVVGCAAGGGGRALVCDNGLRAVMIPTLWGEHPPYHHTRHDPFWEVCEDLV